MQVAHTVRRGLALVAIAVAVLGGCGSSGEDSTATAGASGTTPANGSAGGSAGGSAASTDATKAEGSTGAVQSANEGELTPPKATLPDIPEELEQGWQPVDAVGERLPLYNPKDETDPAIGMQVPVLTGYDIDGNVIRIDPANQGKTMIVLLAHWCPHCNKEVPVINDLVENTALPSDLNIVGVLTVSDPKKPNWPPAEWIRSMEWKNPAMLDGLANQTIAGSDEIVPVSSWYFGMQGVPSMILVDEDGTVKGRFGGEVGYNDMIERINDGLYAG